MQVELLRGSRSSQKQLKEVNKLKSNALQIKYDDRMGINSINQSQQVRFEIFRKFSAKKQREDTIIAICYTQILP